MIDTTLLPTLIHVLVGLAGFWGIDSPSWRAAVAKLQDPPTPGADGRLPEVWINDVTRLIRRGIYWGWLRSAGTVVALGLLAWAAWRGAGLLLP